MEKANHATLSFFRMFRMMLLLAGVILFITACSGGGSNPPAAGSSDSGDEISQPAGDSNGDVSSSDGTLDDLMYEETRDFMEEADRMLYEDFAREPVADRVQSMIDYALNQDIVAEAAGSTEVGHEYVLIRFVNGAFHLISFVDDSMDYPTGEDSRTVAGFPSDDARQAADFSWVVPEGNAPTAVFGEHWCYTGETSVSLELAELARQHGYQSYAARFGTLDPSQTSLFMGVEFFKSLADYQLVYIHSHGDYIDYRGKKLSTIMTNDLVTENNQAALKKDLGWEMPYVFSSSIVERDPVSGAKDKVYYYAVSDLFLKNYCGTFANNSIVHLSMCHGAEGAPPPMATVFHSKNVDAVLGWTDAVSSGASIYSSKYLYTRMFGDIPGYLQDGYINAKTPPLRPYSLEQAYAGLKSKGWNADFFNPQNQAQLMVLRANAGSTTSSTDIMLVPSITSMTVKIDPIKNEEHLTLFGQFGKDSVKVLVNDTEARIVESDHDQIVVDLTSLEDKANGSVVVESRGRKSNKHILSLWEQTVSGEGQLNLDGSPEGKADCTIAFRGEVLRERSGDPESDPDSKNGEMGTNLEMCSECTISAGGRTEDASYTYDYSPVNQTMQVTVNPPDQLFLGALASRDGELRYQINLSAKGQETKTSKDTGSVFTREVLYVFPLYFTASIDEEGVIAAGTDTLDNFTIDWQESEASPKPDDKIAH